MNKVIDYKRMGERLRELRVKQELSQSKLAEMVGCSDGYVSQIERGTVKPSLEFLVNISSLYRVTVDYLLVGSGSSLPEIELDGRIKGLLDQANPSTLRTIGDMIELLLRQQNELNN